MHDTIKTDLKSAMMAKDALKVSVLRGIVAAFTNELVSKGRKPTDALSEDEMLAVIKRLGKQRRDSAEQFRAGGREDLAEKEDAERALLEAYLPAELPDEEIIKAIEAKKAELGASDPSKLGVLVGAVMKELKGKADGARVKALIEASFS